VAKGKSGEKDLYFCCCEGDNCNKEFKYVPEPAPLSTVQSINFVIISRQAVKCFHFTAPHAESIETATSQMISIAVMVAVLLVLIIIAFTSYRCSKMRSFNQVRSDF